MSGAERLKRLGHAVKAWVEGGTVAVEALGEETIVTINIPFGSHLEAKGASHDDAVAQAEDALREHMSLSISERERALDTARQVHAVARGILSGTGG